MDENQIKNIPDKNNYYKHLLALFKTYPKMLFFIVANECLFQVNEYWCHLFEYPYWWRQLLSIVMCSFIFKYNDLRPEKTMQQAVIANNIQEIHRLIQNRSWQVNITSLFGDTPLHFACSSSVNNEIVLLLLEYGANPDVRSNYNGNPVHIAASTKNLIKLGYLIQYGANLNIQDRQGKTPLHWAVDSNSLRTVTFLVEHGADRTICDENNKTPLELCRVKSEWEDIFNYLNGLGSG